ncbi:MAG: calcium/sodium antiporter [Prolixibacteraceae bacterium]|jgi:cation:H+ antiporter|nr:calcium/sodium antiporter [Prolixibacteraceae bacterium]MDI9564446.1 calcium/sodium antiporter [Bacteroidota bacterium]NLT00805.1 calcium/sodium antiporter [Bacteroidales bacterium]OQB79735.1 MAG: Inner membrane protein YrbG [Bacteroidetes bacterium ADurb.Bin123]HNU77008.1 calcium/sodium antiporter [Prolixibacteraceae bacterium]
MWHLIILLAGFVPLIYGADLLVDYASALAKKLNIPNIVIGLTIVAFGTSAPELVVNVFASLEHNSAIALGNILGSNIFNIGGILAVSAIITPLAVRNSTTWIEIPLALLAGIVVFALANDKLIDGSEISSLSRIDGIVLLIFFVIFLVYNFTLIKKGGFTDEVSVKDVAPWKATLLVIAGLVLLVAGGRVIVYGAIEVASRLGISERVIGLTIVSIGTSLPELATSVVAARKKNFDIAIGNVVGSNIFNIFFILGVSATIYPVSVQKGSNIDILMNILLGLIVFVFIFTGKEKWIDRKEGIVMLLIYLGYLGYLIAIPA